MGRRTSMDAEVARVAARQHGAFTRGQAREAGAAYDTIRARVRRGEWSIVVSGVLTLAGVEHTPWLLAAAASLATGGVVSHRLAGALWGLRELAPGEPPEVTVHPRCHLAVPGVLEHRVPLAAAEVVRWRGVRVTDRSRTLVDLLGALPLPQARGLLFAQVGAGRVDAQLLSRQVVARRGRHGTAQLRTLLADLATGAHSAAEVLLHQILTEAKITGWLANQPVHRDGRLLGIVDVLFPEVGLVIEVDGQRYHSADEAFQRDRTRQNDLVMAGYTVLRFTWADLEDRPGMVVALVRQALLDLGAPTAPAA